VPNQAPNPAPNQAPRQGDSDELGPDGLTVDESQRQTRERLVFFSDAVIAIALTLLAFELPVPEGTTEHAIWQSFVHLLPRNYLMFTISFLVIGGFWHTHHTFFQRIDRADSGLNRLNLLCLLMIVLMPFASRVLGQDGDFRFGVIFYAVGIAAVALCYLAMIRYAVRQGLTRPGASPAVLRSMSIGVTIVAAVFLLSIPVALLNTNAATYSWLVLVLAPLRRRWVRWGRQGHRGHRAPEGRA
jgi:uncharacterized membrane protein